MLSLTSLGAHRQTGHGRKPLSLPFLGDGIFDKPPYLPPLPTLVPLYSAGMTNRGLLRLTPVKKNYVCMLAEYD